MDALLAAAVQELLEEHPEVKECTLVTRDVTFLVFEYDAENNHR